jgi:plasmid stabilization system protein ParE
MALRVRWSPRAADDLEAIAEYISLDSPAYAKSVIKTILEITRKFSQFPLAGRIVPEFNDENIREWFAYSYRIIYRLDQNIVTVAAIVHGRRMLTMEDK